MEMRMGGTIPLRDDPYKSLKLRDLPVCHQKKLNFLGDE
jgi:hypothetical protein